jgi:hypothetical protein
MIAQEHTATGLTSVKCSHHKLGVCQPRFRVGGEPVGQAPKEARLGLIHRNADDRAGDVSRISKLMLRILNDEEQVERPLVKE